MHAEGTDVLESLEQDRVDVGAKLGENIVIVGAERYEIGDGEGSTPTRIRRRTRSA